MRESLCSCELWPVEWKRERSEVILPHGLGRDQQVGEKGLVEEEDSKLPPLACCPARHLSIHVASLHVCQLLQTCGRQHSL